MYDDSQHIGRLREIRLWRQLSIRAVAELSGLSFGYLAKLERGEKPVTKRATLESLATTLRVSPTELTGQPYGPAGQESSETHEALMLLEESLESFELGDDPGGPIREWHEVRADVDRLADLTHVNADYAKQGLLVPKLMAELHAAYVRQHEHRRDALLWLIQCYSAACWTTKRLGGRGLPLVAARMAQECARELEAPQWLGYATWLRGDASGQFGRQRQYLRTVRTADDLRGSLNDPEVSQVYGMLHLSAALGAAAQRDRDAAIAHLDEAGAVANRQQDEVGNFARLWFGRTNVGIWRVAIAAELGDGPKVVELAKDLHPEVIPSRSRQAEFLCDYGRSLMTERDTCDQGLSAVLRAEALAPQRVRNDVFVREAVADSLRRARRDAGGRELRGLAWRMGIAPVG